MVIKPLLSLSLDDYQATLIWPTRSFIAGNHVNIHKPRLIPTTATKKCPSLLSRNALNQPLTKGNYCHILYNLPVSAQAALLSSTLVEVFSNFHVPAKLQLLADLNRLNVSLASSLLHQHLLPTAPSFLSVFFFFVFFYSSWKHRGK